MAKGSPFTTFTGKLGQTVGFIIKNSASKQVQGIRAYQSQVANPKSVLQSNQRLVMKPLNNIARALKPIIERGFEGVKYGAQSRQKFLSINMADFSGPYLVKGDERAVPGPVQIAQGSLVPISINQISQMGASANNRGLLTDLFINTAGAVPVTVAGLSAELIGNNSDIKDGDQLTFISVCRVAGVFVYRATSFIVNTESEDSLSVLGDSRWQLGDLLIAFTSPSATGAKRLIFTHQQETDEVLVAGAVIQSRDGDSRYERSNAFLWVSDAIKSEFMSASALEAAINSYAANGGSVDWPEEATGDGELRRVSYPVLGSMLVGATGINSVNALGFLREDGQISVYVLRGNDGSTYYQLIGTDGQPLTITVEDTTMRAQLNADGIATYITTGRYGLWSGSTIDA